MLAKIYHAINLVILIGVLAIFICFPILLWVLGEAEYIQQHFNFFLWNESDLLPLFTRLSVVYLIIVSLYKYIRYRTFIWQRKRTWRNL